ncbi:hypothetical protein [Labilibaculum manganireducens]|uniref:hypothetical protein n=1 Tax=Labilibaculum manganireducens TaxID=1940525 RepID=UPI0029F47834|nr:hypothetical protein [Labilibaculum manganireducens]
MDNKLYNTIQELGRSIQFTQEAAKRQCTSSSVNPQNAFQSELNYKMQQYVHNMHTYLNIDRVLGFPIQPMNYSSETRVSERGVSIRVAIHHYPPVKPMIIEAPEMILELRAIVDKDGQMRYHFTNYFANPENFKALGKNLPEGSCLVLNENGSLSVEYIEEPFLKSSEGSFFSVTGEDASSGGITGGDILGGALTTEGAYSTLLHNHTTYATTNGLTKNIYKANGRIRSARARGYANVSKTLKRVGTAGSVVTTGMAYYDIAKGNQQPITYVDAGVGTAGLMTTIASYYSGAEIPYVGEFIALYGTLRLTWDVSFNLGINYGPSTWYGDNDYKWFE